MMEYFDAISKSHSDQNFPSKALLDGTKHELAHATEEVRKPWKPLSFSPSILVSFALFTAGLAAMLGVLQWQNSRNGALLYAATGDTFSSMDTFLYRFCPTIIVVFYGIGWNWVDLDVKRLEPWFQMAQSRGSSARASLLLHYPADFLPLVPFKAAQRRQWSVLTASAITLLVAWAVTPLQNGIFANKFVNLPQVIDVTTSSSLLPLADQSSKLGLSILNDGFSILWLGQSMPAFTSAEYAIAPFKISEAQELQSSNNTLSGESTMYGTDLDCKPPAQVLTHGGQITFDDGDGCVALDLIPTPGNETSLSYYIGYYDDANSDFALQSPGCPQKSSHSFLAIWKLPSTFSPDFHDGTKVTALFCKPSYYKQLVNATVSLPGYSVISTSSLGPRYPLSERDFNVTQFEYLLGNGVPPPWLALAPQDIVETTVLHPDSRLQNTSLTVPVMNMVGFAVGITHFAPEDYLDPVKLSHAFQSAHRLLFSLGVQKLFTPIDPTSLTTGLVRSTLQAVTIVPVFAFLSEALLALIAVAICLLLYMISRRPSKLASDPDSLAQVMAMFSDESLRKFFSYHDASDNKTLERALTAHEFVIDLEPRSYHPTVAIAASKANERPLETEVWPKLHLPQDWEKPTSIAVQPIEYSLLVGLPLCLGLIIALASLVYLHQKSFQDNGIPLPSLHPITQQVVLNYIPTALATVLEPTWSLLTRLACVMRPLEELRRGNAKAQRSLLLKYTSLPPPLVMWRAIKSQDVFLVILAFTTISANLLTVAVSGLFTLEQRYHGHPTTLNPGYLPRFLAKNTSDLSAYDLDRYNQNDAFYVASANFTNRTSLPAWTSQHYFFLPFPLDASLPNDGSVVITLQATGYGADLECQEMTTTPSDAMFEMKFNSDATMTSIITSNLQSDGSRVQCTTDGDVAGNEQNLPKSQGLYIPLAGYPRGRKSFEISTDMLPLSYPKFSDAEVANCQSLIARGWVRANFSLANAQGLASNLSAGDLATVSSTLISCHARPKSAMFNVTLSPSGELLASTRFSPPTYDLPASVDLTLPLQTTTTNFVAGHRSGWHDDLFASDWSNYLFKTLTNSTAFLDAHLPPPSFDTASAVLSETYSRLFAIQMSLQSARLEPAPSESPMITVEFLTLERRVFMYETMFRISIAILLLDLVVAVSFYSQARNPFLPRLPTSIASQMAYCAGSHVIDDVRKAGGDLLELDKHGYRYGYGKYVGKDGKTHIGIERASYVTKLTSQG